MQVHAEGPEMPEMPEIPEMPDADADARLGGRPEEAGVQLI